MNTIYHTKNQNIVCVAAPGGYGHLIPILNISLYFSVHNNVYLLCFKKIEMVLKNINLIYIEECETYEIDTYINILDQIKPSIVIDDWLPAFKIASYYNKIKCKVSILRCEQFIGYKIINYQSSKRFLSTNVAEINETLEQYNLPKVHDFRELLVGDITLVPSIPEIDPLPINIVKTYGNKIIEHIGPLVDTTFVFNKYDKTIKKDVEKWIELHKLKHTVIVCITFGSVLWYNFDTLTRIIQELDDDNIAIIVSVINREQKVNIEKVSTNKKRLKVLIFPDMFHLFLNSDIVIHHCGHGTALMSILANVKQITIPSGEFDRDDNAVRLERLGVSRRFASCNYSFNIKDLVMNVKDDNSMKTNLAQLSKRINLYKESGLNKADRLVNSFL